MSFLPDTMWFLEFIFFFTKWLYTTHLVEKLVVFKGLTERWWCMLIRIPQNWFRLLSGDREQIFNRSAQGLQSHWRQGYFISNVLYSSCLPKEEFKRPLVPSQLHSAPFCTLLRVLGGCPPALQASSLPIFAHGFRFINRLKKNEITPLAPIRMDLEIIILNEVR